MPRSPKDKFGFAFIGIDEIDKALAAVSTKIQRKAIQMAMKKGLKAIFLYIKQHCPSDTGELKKALKLEIGKKVAGEIWVNAGPSMKVYKREAKKAKAEGKKITKQMRMRFNSNSILKFLEFGTRRNGKWLIKPMGFVRKAYDMGGKAAADLTRSLIIEEINKELDRLAAKGSVTV